MQHQHCRSRPQARFATVIEEEEPPLGEAGGAVAEGAEGVPVEGLGAEQAGDGPGVGAASGVDLGIGHVAADWR